MPISTEDYLRSKVLKDNKQQSDDKLSECIGRFVTINNDEQVNKIEMERKGTGSKSAANRKYGHNMY